MESQKQSNRIYLTPEQVAENNRKSRYNWYLNHKEYYKPGGYGFECITRKVPCDCGRDVTESKLKIHLATKLHMKRIQKKASVPL
jgi:hypothetical protein